MARTNPVMKHAKPTMTPEQIAVEEFMDSIPPEFVEADGAIVDNSLVEDIVQPEVSLDPIVESAVVADNLDELATDVDGISSAVAMESYKRLFHQICDMTGHPVASVESYKPTKGDVKRLAKDIRSHAATIRSCVNLSLEDYVDQADTAVGKMMSNYKQALGKLNAMKSDIKEGWHIRPVDMGDVWQLFHMHNELISFEDFNAELKGIKELEELISKGIANIKSMATGKFSGEALSKFLVIMLLNNTTVNVKKGRAEFEVLPTPKPPREWTATDWPMHLAYGLFGKNYTGGKGEEQTAMLQSVKAIQRVIEELKKLGPVMAKLEKDSAELIKFIETVPADKKAEIKRAASPVLELTSNTIKHVTEVTYGIMKVFEKVSK